MDFTVKQEMSTHDQRGLFIRIIHKCLWGLLAFFLLSGCETTRLYDFHVNAVSGSQTGPQPPQQSFTVVDVTSTINQKPLYLLEVKNTVSAALTGLGMYEADTIEKADLLIYISYGMHGPIPVSVPRNKMRVVQVNYGKPNPQEGLGPDESPNPPNFIIKDDPDFDTELQAPKFLRITALENIPADDLFKGVQPKQVWSVLVKNTNLDRNLRTYVLVMSAVAMKYIDKETDNFIWMYLYSNDPDVKFIKQTLKDMRVKK